MLAPLSFSLYVCPPAMIIAERNAAHSQLVCNSLPVVLTFPQVHGSSDLPSRSASLFHLEGFNFAALGEDSGAEECAVQLLQVYALSWKSRSERQLREGSGVLHSVF
ncbi:hypothetical protein R1flu_011105 [Riccia fluitans]|uniref:Uncharacterized protein n=1 Tax=Riccia fluitans TaxID=41844 RepID=A0ABD1Z7T6_9MARC